MATRAKGWDAELYEGRFSFVWNLGSDLVDLLDPRKGERIVDLGSGTGHLAGKIAERGAEAIGFDSSPAMVAQARLNYPNLRFELEDVRRFAVEAPVDAVFSNAVLHWVRDAGDVLARISAALRPGGRFVAEFGSKGNIANILSAVRQETGIDSHPWYFPSLGEYATLLESHGFRVTHGFEIDRDTLLEGERAIEDWLAMFGEKLMEPVAPPERVAAVGRIRERLRNTLYRDGAWWADYKRIRVRALKTD